MAFIFVFLTFFGSAETGKWNCKNEVEIVCSKDGCEPSADFTPMSVTVSESGDISVCAYTGCWEGSGKGLNEGNFLTFSAPDLPFSTQPSSKESIFVVIDKTDGVGLLKAGKFAHPVVCKKSD